MASNDSVTKPGTRKRAHAQIPDTQSKRVRHDQEYLDQAMERAFLETEKLQSLKPDSRYRECEAFPGMLPESFSLEYSPYFRCGPDHHGLGRRKIAQSTAPSDNRLSGQYREHRSQAPSPDAKASIGMSMISPLTPETVSTASSKSEKSQDSGPTSPSSTSSIWTPPTSISSSHQCSPKKRRFERGYIAEGFANKRQKNDGTSYDHHEWSPLELKGITPEQLRSSLASSKRPEADMSEYHPKFSVLRLPRQGPHKDITNPFGQKLN